ncbi:hypothetical protein [Acidipropionibacterium timonense]|uniref:hypothetical protein n=1 Tax=Acidipropionibacterium timonense TaxID=2161818 RepID=UPI0010315EAE|nr:hypothetical protein [Acidipropionibacterium timonense]
MIVDIEAVVVAALIEPDGPVVSTERPRDTTGPQVQVRASGGPTVRSHVLDERIVTITVCHDSAPQASVLAGTVRDQLYALEGISASGGVYIASVECTAPSWFPDEDGRARYVMTATLLTQHN